MAKKDFYTIRTEIRKNGKPICFEEAQIYGVEEDLEYGGVDVSRTYLEDKGKSFRQYSFYTTARHQRISKDAPDIQLGGVVDANNKPKRKLANKPTKKEQ